MPRPDSSLSPEHRREALTIARVALESSIFNARAGLVAPETVQLLLAALAQLVDAYDELARRAEASS